MEAIVACALHDGAIGYKGGIPWVLPSDLARFKQITCEHPQGLVNAVIMGRRTWASLGKKLPGRMNVVISRTLRVEDDPNVHVFESLSDAYAVLDSQCNIHKIFVIGGESLYEEAMASGTCETIHVTLIHNYKDEADTFFPFDRLVQNYVSTYNSDLYQENGVIFSFHTYQRKQHKKKKIW
jgi:dihydrofolate reductase